MLFLPKRPRARKDTTATSSRPSNARRDGEILVVVIKHRSEEEGCTQGHHEVLGSLAFAEQVRTDQRALRPKDTIDLQSFIWVQGSDEYE